jgi:hypothetical protein
MSKGGWGAWSGPRSLKEVVSVLYMLRLFHSLSPLRTCGSGRLVGSVMPHLGSLLARTIVIVPTRKPLGAVAVIKSPEVVQWTCKLVRIVCVTSTTCSVVLSVAGGSHLRFPLSGSSPKLQTSWPREDRSTPEASITSAVVDELLWIRDICHQSWPSSASEVLSVYW